METEAIKKIPATPAGYFANLVHKPHQGSFKVFVGQVPQGQLFDFLVREARQLMSAGLEVVIALDEKHGKVSFPQSQVIPLREIKETKYREVNYDEILRRTPDVVVIDNLLHMSMAGEKPEPRYQNIKNILSRGISVVSSAYSPWDANLKTVLEFLGNGISVPVERWAELPKEEVVALVFTPKETFSHAELLSSN